MSSTTDAETSSVVSAKFLQARITALSTTLIKRLENIFAAALEEDGPSNRGRSAGSTTTEQGNPPSLTDTAVKQLQLDVESTALIRAAEDLMMLTRSMKELWLFGGLNTIPEADGTRFGITADERKQIVEDEQTIMRGIRSYLDSLGSVDDGNERVNGTTTTNGTSA